jgi:hypothetical protein
MISPVSAIPAFTHVTPQVTRPQSTQEISGNTINIVQANTYNIAGNIGNAYIANEIDVSVEGDNNLVNIIQANTYNISQGGGVIPFLDGSGLLPDLLKNYINELMQQLIEGQDNGQVVDMVA